EPLKSCLKTSTPQVGEVLRQVSLWLRVGLLVSDEMENHRFSCSLAPVGDEISRITQLPDGPPEGCSASALALPCLAELGGELVVVPSQSVDDELDRFALAR